MHWGVRCAKVASHSVLNVICPHFRLVQVMNYSYLTLMNRHQLDHSNGQLLALQHGEDECQLNAIEACVIRIWPDAVMPSCVEIK